MLNIFRGFVLLLLSSMGVAHAADTGWLTSPQNDHARIRFQAERSENRLYGLLTVELQSGWKTYWRSPGEGGVAPEIHWHNGEKAQWYWPVPSRFEISGLTTQGYHKQVVIPMIITGQQSDALDGTLTLSTCSNVCLLTDYPLHLDFSQPVDDHFQQAFEQAMRSIPAESGISDDLSAHLAGSNLVVTGTTAGEWRDAQIYFDPLDGGIIPGDPTLKSSGAELVITAPVTDEWGEKTTSLAGKTLSFVLTNQGKAQQTTLTVGADQAVSTARETTPANLAQMLLFALLGGLILNLMPCVLPVMGMKLNSVLHSGTDKTRIRLRFLATSAGILTSFALLAAMVTVLKFTGASLGWGIQFQNPWFIGLMVAVTFIFAMNLLGLFEMLLPASMSGRMATAGGNGLAGSFCEGVFATLLATPCSAPFLGTAVAFALAAPLTDLWLVFMLLGLGMALPWLLVALVPKIALLLPRPGPWMNSLKVLLALMMLASSLWLASLLGLHLGSTASGIITLLLTATALIVFIATGQRRAPLFWLGVILLAAFGGYQLRGMLSADDETSARTPHQQIAWQPLSEEAITRAQAQGKRVFVDISADWCVTCKVNEHRVLNQPEIIAALNQPDVVALRGDWSQPSDLITAFLQTRNSYAIPFNQVYGPGLTDGKILPPLLDKSTVLDTLKNAKG
ncbi:protein-disulfide reductase DsbD family protein [Kluyvera huaxiensis]|uniref:protein-disulfide reductase DsbD family protein n=1 Tax=Kluyvera sp. 142053 TaxID=3160979 RepID=UPI0032DEDE17